MVAIRNREGREVAITVYGKSGAKRKIENIGQLEALLDSVGSGAMGIVKRSIARLDFGNIFLIAVIGIKKYLLGMQYEEFNELMDGYLDIDYVEVEFAGRKLKFVGGGSIVLGRLQEIFIRNQYDANEGNIRGKVVVDAGANIGAFALFCACLGAKKIYAFEPVEGTYRMLRRNVEASGLQNVIVPVKKALGEKECKALISCNYAGDGGASIGRRESGRRGTQEIEVMRLDDYLGGGEVDFIKMDVEGHEEMALAGAGTSISKWKPVLSLSAYHKQDDLEVLPKTIKGIRGDYRIKVLEYYEKELYCD